VELNLFIIAVWTVAVAGAAGLAAVLGWMYGRGRRDAERTYEDIPVSFSREKYYPMNVLLSLDEENFLATLPGYRPEMRTRFRRDRRRIFRMYLRDLRRDFGRLHSQARALAAHSGAEGAGLVSALLRQQVAFWASLAMLEVRLALHWAGADSVAVRDAVECVERMRLNVSQFENA